MNKELIKELINQWLSEKEAQIYLTLLELWKSWAATLSRRTGIKRVTIYALLKSMTEKSVVTMFQEKGVNTYVAISPDKLLNRKKHQLEIFEQKIPEFLNIVDKRWKRPQIEYYDWVSGIKKMYEHLLVFKNPMYAFLSDDDIHENLHDYLNYQYVEKRRKKKIHAHVLVNRSEVNETYQEQVRNDPLTTIKLINQELDWLEWETILYGENNVMFALYSANELVWYTIQSTQLYNSLMTLFNFVRKHGK